jgi:hypothetical protein
MFISWFRFVFLTRRPNAKVCPGAILALGMALSCQAGEGLLAGGLRGQGTVDLLPGNDYFMGPTLAYSNFYLFNHKLQIQGSFLTNRPEAAARQGVPVQDWYLLTPVWHFSRNSFFDPIFQLDLGWSWFDDEGLGLDNTAFTTAPSIGLNLNLAQGRYGAQAALGYQTLTSSMVNPGLAWIQVWTML